MNVPIEFHHLMLVDTEFEKILTNPILDIAARFWDEERYEAFKVCYKSMREIDDLVDHRKAEGTPLIKSEIGEYSNRIRNWSGRICNGTYSQELSQTISLFQIPVSPWQRLGKEMIYDLDHNGFSSLPVFLRYCEGAAIAPASIFMHLCGVKKVNGKYESPEFDIRQAARPLALFSYLVHIMRDFEKDQRRQLNYFADDILRKCGLNKDELNKLVHKQSSDDRIWALFSEYKRIAEYYQKLAGETFKYLLPQLAPKYQLSLHIIFSLYSHLYEKIDPDNHGYSETDLNLSPFEVQQRLNLAVSTFEPV